MSVRTLPKIGWVASVTLFTVGVSLMAIPLSVAFGQYLLRGKFGDDQPNDDK